MDAVVGWCSLRRDDGRFYGGDMVMVTMVFGKAVAYSPATHGRVFAYRRRGLYLLGEAEKECFGR